MRVDNSTGKGTSSMDKISSKVHRVHMELGGKLLYSSRSDTQFLERLQSVGVVDGATHTQKDDVESNVSYRQKLSTNLLLHTIVCHQIGRDKVCELRKEYSFLSTPFYGDFLATRPFLRCISKPTTTGSVN